MRTVSARRSWIVTLLYAAFLAGSWTWCIGMYLPGLLVREFGLWGWVVFAVPNVVGAAAMGFVLTRESSRRLVERHLGACRMFSIVVIAFHVFWVAWVFPRLFGNGELFAFAIGVALMLPLRRWGAVLRLGAAVLTVSLISFAVTAVLPDRPPILADAPRGADGSAEWALVYLAPVFLFGFALSPYLDLTFHRVCRSKHSGQRRAAFAIGFGVMFLAMILFSLVYAPLQFVPSGARGGFLQRLLATARGDGYVPALPTGLTLALGCHMTAQAAYTVFVHLRELVATAPNPVKARRSYGSFAMGLPLLVASLIAADIQYYLLPGDTIYRLFLSFFGVIFPGYVWVCIVPRRRELREEAVPPLPRRGDLITLLVALAVTAPMFWLGFIEERWAWLPPAVVVLFVAGLWRMWAAARERNAPPARPAEAS